MAELALLQTGHRGSAYLSPNYSLKAAWTSKWPIGWLKQLWGDNWNWDMRSLYGQPAVMLDVFYGRSPSRYKTFKIFLFFPHYLISGCFNRLAQSLYSSISAPIWNKFKCWFNFFNEILWRPIFSFSCNVSGPKSQLNWSLPKSALIYLPKIYCTYNGVFRASSFLLSPKIRKSNYSVTSQFTTS